MSNYVPPNAHQVNLIFKDLAIGGSDLNFGINDQKLAQIDINVDVSIDLELFALTSSFNGIDVLVDTNTHIEIVAVVGQLAEVEVVVDCDVSIDLNAARVDQFCIIDVVLDTNPLFNIEAYFDINHLVGVSCGLNSLYYSAISRLGNIEIPWSKPILRVSNEALFYERGLVLSQQAFAGFDKGLTLSQSIRIEHEKTTRLSADAYIVWQSGDKRFIHNSLLFDESLKLRVNCSAEWQEMIRRRRNITYSHEVAKVFEKRFSFEWDKGLELITKDEIAWDKAKAIHYRKHPIQPWPKPEITEYTPSTDFNFNCLCHDGDSHNVVLNFGVDDCIPAIPNKKWWYILNSLNVTRLDNGEKITVYNGSYNTDRSRWCWSYSLTVPDSEISKLDPISGQPVILKIVVNGNEHHMLLENRSRSRSFANTTWNLTGRSQTALLDAPYSALRSFLQENERTSVQLVQAEIDRSSSQPNLNWKLIDDLGWIVANESLSYSNLSPIAAIKMVVESGGGFVYSEKGSNTLSIKPLYKKTFWDSLAFADYDRLIPESIVTSLSTDFELYPNYNAITLTNDRHALHAEVKRTGSAGDVLLPSENSALFNHVSMGAYAKSKLSKSGMVETHSLVMPINSDIGECAPGEILAFNAEWWGIIDSVNVSFTYSKVTQTVTVERVNNE